MLRISRQWVRWYKLDSFEKHDSALSITLKKVDTVMSGSLFPGLCPREILRNVPPEIHAGKAPAAVHKREK